MRRWLLSTAIVVLCGACAKMPPTHYYMLDPRQAATAEPSPDGSGWDVGVRTFQVDAPYDRDQIVYRIGEGSAEIGFYAYHRWATPPSRMLPVLVARAMAGASGIRRIEPSMAGREYTAYLDGRVERLEEIDRPGGQLVRVRLTLWLGARDGTELWSGTFEAEQSIRANEVADVVDRMGEAVDQALGRAREDLEASLASRSH